MVTTPKPPAAPDPYATAQAQTAMNKETAISQTGLNAMNQYGPDGALEFSQNGSWADGTPRFSATQSLSPSQQRLNDLNNQTQANLGEIGVNQSRRIGELLSQPYDISQGAIDGRVNGMAKMPTAYDTDRRYTQPDSYRANTDAPQVRALPDPVLVGRQDIGSNAALAGSLFAAGRNRLDPVLAERREGAESLLANKGLTAGSTGYDRTMSGIGRDENDAYNQLFLTGQGQAFDQAATRANTTFGQDISRFGQFFGQSAQKSSQEFEQDLAGRNFTNAALGQNFGQGLAANQQNFGQDLAATNQLFGMGQTNFQNAMSQRAAALQELQAQRNQPLNEIGALISGSQVSPQSFVNTPQTQVQGTDYTGLVGNIYGTQMQGYASQNQARASAYNGLGSIFGSVTKMFSPIKFGG